MTPRRVALVTGAAGGQGHRLGGAAVVRQRAEGDGAEEVVAAAEAAADVAAGRAVGHDAVV